jgi:hypothetical protein
MKLVVLIGACWVVYQMLCALAGLVQIEGKADAGRQEAQVEEAGRTL